MDVMYNEYIDDKEEFYTTYGDTFITVVGSIYRDSKQSWVKEDLDQMEKIRKDEKLAKSLKTRDNGAESYQKLKSDEQSLRNMKTKAIGTESFGPGGKEQLPGASIGQKSRSSIPVKVRHKGKLVDRGSSHNKSRPQTRSEQSPWSLIEPKLRGESQQLASPALIVYKKGVYIKSHRDKNTGTSCKEIYKHPNFNPESATAAKQKQRLRSQGK